MTFVSAISAINIDILYSGLPRVPALGEEVASAEFGIQIGGGPTASLITLKRLGINVRLGTYLSSDNTSAMGRMLLEQYGLDYTNLYKGRDMAVNVTSIASFPEDRYFLTYFTKIDDRILSDDEMYSFFKDARVIFGLDGRDEVMKKLKDEGKVVVYDIGWSDGLSINKLKDTLKHVNVFTPNDKEALKMTGSKDILEALDIISGHVESVVITLGRDGSLAKSAGRIFYAPPVEEIKAVDTTGAGDNFLAGVVYGLYNDWPMERCMMMGNVTGGYSTTALGCCKAKITPEITEQLMASITVMDITSNRSMLNKILGRRMENHD